MDIQKLIENIKESRGWKRTTAIVLAIIARFMLAAGQVDWGMALFDVATLIGLVGVGHAVVDKKDE